MELFESIGLKADPFTTSPNPDLFFPAKEHKQCLEGLELAIRMRRGLSVVRGGIGTGKTTISRKLIQNFSSDDDIKFEFYPVLDPKFESELVLLQHLVDLFGIEADAGKSVIDCRNQIEHHLIKAGVEDGRVLVLVIDEGQNLKGEFLDVFRTLNPNDYGKVFNDSFLKRYFTANLKKQWGQNLIKFQGVKLPGGVELNGRQIYDDAMNDLTIIREQMSNTYEIPPLDMIG